ncbi:hypothetical protein A3E35_00820 [Candidatus Giovannonibacteria bacterium RIFCSPHIGHO2_12_FULL_44_22]|nr:MAG: hypothetical protein A3E35_00820 [Candidatus Giovannonibacteria bacterium RIFCSPHIGHO2_12_FULL_44_22]
MYISQPVAPNGKAVVLIHEFWGVNDQMKRVADRVAETGYLALAADLYGGKVAQTREEASEMRNKLDVEKAVSEIKKSLAFILENYQINNEKVAVWGFCMGGMVSFESAVRDIGAGAYVIYYGKVSDDKEILKNIQKPILGIFGGLDKNITRDLVSRFKNALEDLGKPSEIEIYDDADHAFFNEEREAHNPKAAADAWDRTIKFLDKNL